MHLHGINWLTSIKFSTDLHLCATQDGWARELGWTVTHIGYGARSYRDPRFDLVRELEELGRHVFS